MTDFYDQPITLTIPFTTRVMKGVSDESDGRLSSLNASNKKVILSLMNEDHTFSYSSDLEHLKKPKWWFKDQTLQATVTIKRRETALWVEIVDYLNGQFSDGWGENNYELPGDKTLHVNSFFPDCIQVTPHQDRRFF